MRCEVPQSSKRRVHVTLRIFVRSRIHNSRNFVHLSNIFSNNFDATEDDLFNAETKLKAPSMLNSIYHEWTKTYSIEATNLQPDITLIVGNIQNAVKFFAHKFVLCNHSGYFKTLLSSYKGYEVHISNINAHTFAYLLAFMYTGQLELNPLNVYEVFLASNLLHMTEALNLCRRYLADSQENAAVAAATATVAKPIVKPIPRKKAFLASATELDGVRTLKYQPLRAADDPASSIFKPVGNANLAAKSLTVQRAEPSNSDRDRVANTRTEAKKTDTPTPSNVIFDIACCDGPIKFRKVINKYYDPNKLANVTKDQGTSPASVACQGCKNVFKNYNKFKKYTVAGAAATAVVSSQHTKPSSNDCGVVAAESKCKKKTETSLSSYSCKTCGSKFPSYYFVHKHRKLHHSEIRGESSE